MYAKPVLFLSEVPLHVRWLLHLGQVSLSVVMSQCVGACQRVSAALSWQEWKASDWRCRQGGVPRRVIRWRGRWSRCWVSLVWCLSLKLRFLTNMIECVTSCASCKFQAGMERMQGMLLRNPILASLRPGARLPEKKM